MKAMTQMENTVMNMTCCNRQTANLVANAILDIDKETNKETELTVDYSSYNVTELRKDIIKAMCAERELGLTYVDWHTEDGKCGLTLITEKGKFDLIITKQ